MSDQQETTANRLNTILVELKIQALDRVVAEKFARYCALLLRWNARTNLTAIRDEEGILRRHFVESISCARALPTEINSLLDFGSGAGFPGIPIALCRTEIAVTLAESQTKKAAFLRESVRVLEVNAKVHSDRAEALHTVFDCVTLRAVDKMDVAVQAATRLVRPGGWLALMTTGRELEALMSAAGREFSWPEVTSLPGGENRILALGEKEISSPV